MLQDKRFERVNAEEFPMMTPNEKNHGYFLYPSQSIVFEMNIEPKDLQHVRVEGTLSRRHLFHQVKELVPSSS